MGFEDPLKVFDNNSTYSRPNLERKINELNGFLQPLLNQSKSVQPDLLIDYKALISDMSLLYIQELRHQARVKYLKQIASEHVTFAVFKTGTLGTEIAVSEEPKFEMSDNFDIDSWMIRHGIFCMTSIGQGNSPAFGLYEIPCYSIKNYRSLVFAFWVDDPTHPDKRMNGREYCILSIFYPKAHYELFADRVGLQRKLTDFIRRYPALTDIEGSFLSELRKFLFSGLK